MKLQPSGAAGGDMLAPVEPVECGPVLLYMQVGGFGGGRGTAHPPSAPSGSTVRTPHREPQESGLNVGV